METAEAVRASVDEVAAARGVALAPAEDGWTTRGVPLAPFPARLRIDADAALLWHDVVAAEVVPPVAVEAAVAEVDLPRPEVRLMVGEARWLVALSYPLPFARVRPSEVAGLLAASPLFAGALATALVGHLSRAWRDTLMQRGLLPGSDPAVDPRDLLRGGTVLPWPELDAPTDPFRV